VEGHGFQKLALSEVDGFRKASKLGSGAYEAQLPLAMKAPLAWLLTLLKE
jgi:hypothetical protein